MPRTPVLFYREDDGTVPVLDWLDALPRKALDKCRVKIGRLHELGYELRRPEADYLGNGIYELRVRFGAVNYRMLYFFHEDIAAVVCRGLVKEGRIPAQEIDRAVVAKHRFAKDPRRHTHEES